ncbi:glycosyl hydrolase [Colletotrichum phormii]|uniref:Glycosyl hydrolase n=1 Tax=Colletotrichum phormii TaxID=359342 RepID=A0AAI9ZHE0_9PEZI|nr:glycosyl hydrolase [Colletotrichum phormii]KAK1624605.1 glycosyl hydrolase [Colletotrichum phormii]
MRQQVSAALSLILLGFGQIGSALTTRQESTFTNPVIWADLADDEVFRIDDTFYYIRLALGAKFSLNGSDHAAYVNGVWASSLGYRESNGVFYWYGCIQGTDETHIYTASSAEGPWTHHDPIPKCYYDLGLLVDTDDTMYIAYGAIDIRLAQLSPDGFTEVRDEVVYTEDAHRYIEGSRFYHINGNYYIWVTKPGDEQHVLKSTSGPWGPYEARQVVAQMKAPVEGAGAPHQGGLVSTQDGKWYYMAFIDVYPGGRAPVLAPVEFDAEGWPNVVTDANGAWGAEYAMPVTTSKTVQGTGSYVDKFDGVALNPRWEWNHNPDNSAWSLGYDGFTLRTATVCEGLYGAANTLTQRIIGPRSQATFHLDISGMVDGDQAGVAALRQLSAYIGIHKVDGVSKLVYVDEISMAVRDSLTTSNGQVKAEGPTVAGSDLWLRIKADIAPPVAGSGAWPNATFWFSTDGDNFEQLGPVYGLNNEWFFFMGYRFSVFNWAKTRLGGSILVREFELEMLE